MFPIFSADINECKSSPCKNSISCIDGVNSYKCVCKPGYTGKNCEVGKNLTIHLLSFNNAGVLDVVLL